METKVNSLMSSHPKSVSIHAELTTAYRSMKQSGYRHMPVLDQNGELVGIISDRDFQRAMWPMPSVDSSGYPDGPVFRKDATVADYMSSPVKTLEYTSTLKSAIDLMLQEKISAVVVTQRGKMTGILTHEDMLKVLSIILEGPQSVWKMTEALAYNSPIGQISEFLAGVGI